MQKSSGKEWDHVWIGGKYCHHGRGAEPYGNLKNAALAVKGERIAFVWI